MEGLYEPLEFDAASPVTGAHKGLQAAAARLAWSICLAFVHMPEAVLDDLKVLLTPKSLWTMCIVIAGWAIATIIGGPIGIGVNALLILYGLYELYGQISGTWGLLKEWALGAINAKNEQELDRAAEAFARAVVGGGLLIIQAIVTHRIFTKIEGSLAKRHPPPEWLNKKYQDAIKQAEDSRKPKPTEETPQSKAKRVAEMIKAQAKVEAIKRSPQVALPAIALAGGTLALVGVVALVVVASSSSGGRSR